LGALQQVVRDLFYTETATRQLADLLLDIEREAGVIRATTFRDRIGLGRKRSIQLLEHFDRLGLTRRFGNERKIRPDSALATATGISWGLSLAKHRGRRPGTLRGRQSQPVLRPGFKPGWGWQPLLGEFDSHCLPPF